MPPDEPAGGRPDRKAWMCGDRARCTPEAEARFRPWRLVLLGAPGAGKGTQAELLSERLGPCPLSTGELFRSIRTLAPAEQTAAHRQALDFMQRGELVPDETVLALVRERGQCLRCQCGFLLDGFPRTLAQAQALDVLLREERLALDAVVSYELPLETVVARLGGRRTCGACRAVYHVAARQPGREGLCDRCGGALVQRDDDRPEAVRVRMEVYERETAPLKTYYRGQGLLVPVAADGSPEDIYERTLMALR